MPTLYSLLSADPLTQMLYYQSGIGTYRSVERLHDRSLAMGTEYEHATDPLCMAHCSPWSPSTLAKKIGEAADKAVAWNLREHLEDAYRYLANTYAPGDKIWLFGFSRGAFSARALAGMIQQCGLISQSVSSATRHSPGG